MKSSIDRQLLIGLGVITALSLLLLGEYCKTLDSSRLRFDYFGWVRWEYNNEHFCRETPHFPHAPISCYSLVFPHASSTFPIIPFGH
jgi:hypothetical protein